MSRRVVKRGRVPHRCALETGFPATMISKLSRHESWRKELHHPATYVQKWWAQRLGTVVRALLCAAVSTDQKSTQRLFRSAARLSGMVVYDPFAGSGTTLVEAAKLGATVIGRDINPVATLAQRQALQDWNLDVLAIAFKSLTDKCSDKVNELYRTKAGEPVLHYFWVAVVQCPECQIEVDLFSRYVFAQHAYPKRFPIAHAVCPSCGDIVAVNLEKDQQLKCSGCGHEASFLGPVSRSGPTPGRHMVCSEGHQSTILKALGRAQPKRRMYAKLVLARDGQREYRPIDDFDRELYSRSERLLKKHHSRLVLPTGTLTKGHNTTQALRWGFTKWASFFNARQLYCLGLTAAAIRDLDSPAAEREALIALFSKAIEFHNMFTSYKGEGTGAIRSIFHNHTLKPERTPLETNPWGSTSGSMAMLFKRLTRAHEYKASPRDLVPKRGGEYRTVDTLSLPLARPLVKTVAELWQQPGAAHVSHGDAATLEIPPKSVHLVVTDPPYVGKVHYSELADFFHAWLRKLNPFPQYPADLKTTRHSDEVQNGSIEAFGHGIERVWKQVHRVLRDDGLLVFSFHEARSGAWLALMQALRKSGFVVTAIQPVMAEMATSVVKSGASEPSHLDAIVVCRKISSATAWAKTPEEAADKATRALRKLRNAGIEFSAMDVRSVVAGSVLALLTNPSLSYDPVTLPGTADECATRAIKSLIR